MQASATATFQSEYLSALLDSINASVVATDDAFIIRYWNKYAASIFEHSAEEVLGKRGYSVLHFTYPGDSEESARQQLMENGLWNGRAVFKQSSGREIVLDASVSIVKDPEGKVMGYVGVHRDITDYSKVQHDLSTLLSTFSNIDDNFFIVDKELRVAFVNEKSSQNLLSHYGIDYNAGDLLTDKLPEEGRDSLRIGLTKALAGKKTSYETRITTTDGRPCWLHATYFPIVDSNGIISHACLIARDITAQKEVEDVNSKLYQSRKLFETFMENSPILSWVNDDQGIIRYLNPAYMRLYKLSREAIGRSLFEVFPAALASQLRENDQLVLSTGQSIKTVERGITPDSKEHLYQVIKFPIPSEEKTFVGGWAMDISEEIQLRESLKESLTRLQKSEVGLKEALEKEHHLNSMKSRFVSMASHEFRTPLSTMLSSTFLLEKYTAAEQQPNRTKHILKIKESIHHMNALLEDFLSLGKLDEGKTVANFSRFELADLMADVIEETEVLKKPGQSVLFDTAGVEVIFTDKKLLRNILVNVLSNAYKFSEEHQRIWISSEKTGNQVCIAVRDEGMGISQEDQQHLFETFFRARNAQNIQGTGLGLHIIKRYTDLLHGKVDLQSQLGKGTTITVTLPAGD